MGNEDMVICHVGLLEVLAAQCIFNYRVYYGCAYTYQLV